MQGRGTVVTGRIEQGIVKVGDDIELVGMQGTPTKTVVTGEIDMTLSSPLTACFPAHLPLVSFGSDSIRGSYTHRNRREHREGCDEQ